MPMETAEILHQFERYTGQFARAAVEAAVARREEITLELLRILKGTVDRAAQLDAEGDYMAHLYAMFLLAQFRETRAYPLMVRFASLPGDLLDSLCGDFITGDLGQVLASVCGGELAGIQSLIENESTDQWVRGAALGSLVTLVVAGQKSRDEIVSYFAALFRGKLCGSGHTSGTRWSAIAPIFTRKSCSTISRRLTRTGWLTPTAFALTMSHATWRWVRTGFLPASQTIRIYGWWMTPWPRWDGGRAFGRTERRTQPTLHQTPN